MVEVQVSALRRRGKALLPDAHPPDFLPMQHICSMRLHPNIPLFPSDYLFRPVLVAAATTAHSIA